MVRVLFNNGREPEDDQNCNSATDTLILDMLFNSTTRRNLRVASRTNDELNGEVSTVNRELYPIYCRDYCLGYAKGTCRATNCKGFRRELEDDYPIENPYNVTCPARIHSMNQTLDTLISTRAVSRSCQRLLKKPRIFECYDDIVYGEIEYINVYDKNNVAIYKQDTILSICRSATVRVEVRVNECVDSLVTNISSASGKNYTLPSGSKFPFYFVWHIFPGFPLMFLGRYTFQYIPDGIVSKSKSLLLDVKDC
jgi:hypothetical protein